jgi:hypothetical protein
MSSRGRKRAGAPGAGDPTRRRRSIRWAVLLLLAGCGPPVYGLRPEYPEPKLESPFLSLEPPARAAFVKVDSLQPTLQWESFPDSNDRSVELEWLLGRIRNVSYDLKLYRAEHDYPAEVIYARSGLPWPSHRVETPLKPSATYFWTVRARFELDGVTRVTPWGRIRGVRSTDLVVPSPFYYGLKTPSE